MSISKTSSTPKNLNPSSVRIGLMNPNIAQTWAQRVLSNGTTVALVKKGDTINHTTSQPIANGLFCQRIFGPCTDYTCACGHEKIRIHINVNIAPLVCPECNVEWTLSAVRRQQLGLIELLSPVTHKWFSNGRNYIPILAGITIKTFKGLKECKFFFPFPLKEIKNTKHYTGGVKKFRSPKSLKSSTKETRLMKNLRVFAESLCFVKSSTEQKRANIFVHKENLTKKQIQELNLERELVQNFYSLISTVEILQRGEQYFYGEGSTTPSILHENSTPRKILNIEKPVKLLSSGAPTKSLKRVLISWKVKKQIQVFSKEKQNTFYNGVIASKKTNNKSFNSTNVLFNENNQTFNNFQPFLKGHVFRDNFKYIETLILNSASLKISGFKEQIVGLTRVVLKNKTTVRKWSVTPLNTNNLFFYERNRLSVDNSLQLSTNQQNKTKTDISNWSGKFSLFFDNQSVPIRPSFTQPEDYRRQFLKFMGSTGLTKLSDIPIGRYHYKAPVDYNNLHHNSHRLGNPSYWNHFYGAPPLGSIISGLLGKIKEPSQLVELSQKEPEQLNSRTLKQVIQPTIEIYFSETKSAAKEQTIKKILLQTGGGGLQKYLEKINLGQLIFFLQKDLLEIAPLLIKSQSTRRILAFIVNKTFNDINQNYSLLEQVHKGSETNIKSNKIIVQNQFSLANKIENLEKQYKDLKKEYKIVKKICSDFQNRKNINKRRYKLAFQLFRTMSTPAGMTLSSIPVLPPELRPIIDVPKIGPITADLNIRYRALVFALRNLRELAYVDFRNTGAAQASVQEAVDELLYTGGKTRRDKGATNMSQNLYKSLAMRLKGKHGRFRGNLLGKRVDYSGRSVIVVGPTLKIHQCGLPFEIAIKLFSPFLIRRLIQKGLCKNLYKAKQVLIKPKFKSLIWALCREVMQEHLVLLNRAPTLHRLGVQAFMPILVSGRAILLHPLVCTGFNADFDGDQMGVHVPLFPKARAEAWKMMWSRNNFLSPSSGEPILLPSQDMVLGCYYLTESSLAMPYKKNPHNSQERPFILKQNPLGFLRSTGLPIRTNNTSLSVPFVTPGALRITAKPQVTSSSQGSALFPRWSFKEYEIYKLFTEKTLRGGFVRSKAGFLRRSIKNLFLGKGKNIRLVSNKSPWNYRTVSEDLASALLLLRLKSNYKDSLKLGPHRNFKGLNLETVNIGSFHYKNLELVLPQKAFFSRNHTYSIKATDVFFIFVLLKKLQANNSLGLSIVSQSSLGFSEVDSIVSSNLDINVEQLSKDFTFIKYEDLKLKINKTFVAFFNSKVFCTAFINYLLLEKFFWPLTYLDKKAKQFPWARFSNRFDLQINKQKPSLNSKGLGTNYEALTSKRGGLEISIYGSKNYKMTQNKRNKKMLKQINVFKHAAQMDFMTLHGRLAAQEPEVQTVKTALDKYTRGLYNLQSIVWVKSNTNILRTEGGGPEGKIPSLELRVTPHGMTSMLQVSEIKKTFFQKSLLLPSKKKSKSPFKVYSVRTTIGRLLFNDVLKKFETL